MCNRDCETSYGDPKKVYSGFTKCELCEAFSEIQNTDGWKLPIDVEIEFRKDASDADVDKAFKLYVAAIDFYTGGGAEIECKSLSNKLYHLTAPGYYEMVGA